MKNTEEVITDTIIDWAESLLDKCSNNALVKQTPILKFFIAAYKDFSTSQKEEKQKLLLGFLDSCADLTEQDILNFLCENAMDSEKTGEALSSLILSLNQIEKCVLIGRLYKNTVFRQILVDDCRRIIHIIQKCNYEDLLLLKDFEPDIEIINNGKFIHSKLGVTNLFHLGLLDEAPWEGGTASTPEEDFDVPGYLINEYGKLVKGCL